MKKNILRRLSFSALAIVCLNITSCATAPKTIIGPDGTPNQLITCGDIEDCYEKAHEVCGGTYKIVNTTSHTSGYNGITDTSQKLLVRCDKDIPTK